jgi:(1->4)-alpha-D-glucan 1-alpha-D-glucosylmutase
VPQKTAATTGETSWRTLLRKWRDGGIKLRITRELLSFRRARLALFQRGDYEPLEATGRFADRLVAFTRRCDGHALIVVVPRLTAQLGCPPIGLVWEDTAMKLPPARTAWRDVLTGREWPADTTVALAELFGDLPLVVLTTGER